MEFPLVSIIVPMYNAAGCIARCVKSICAMFNARANNAGWRIDYFLVSDRIADKITATPIYSDIQGSDHCPVGLEIEL